VARHFADEADLPRADYISRLALHLGSVGIEVEQVIPTVSGEPDARLPGRISVILSHFHPDPSVRVPFDATDARTWGRYVAGMHAACRGWRPPSPLPSPWTRE
jgi:Ser/Thr protein kinase RdoA (MazF antagonist)